MVNGYYMSGPEEGDQIDQTVLVCDEHDNEVIKITAGSLRNRKKLGRALAQLLNEAGAVII